MLRRLPTFWSLQIGGWLAYGVLIYITLVPTLHVGQTAQYLLFVKFVRTLIGFTVSLGMRRIYKRLRARGASPAALAVAALLCSVLFGCLWGVLYRIFGAILNPAATGLVDWSTFPRDVLDYAYVLLAWSASYFSIKAWQDAREERERALEATALAREAQLEMLRYQINPHFLFNALNSIRASIDEDRARARRMVTELSEFLRYSLLDATTTEVPLSEEIEAVRSYLAIERIRFEDKLDVEFDIEPAAESFLLPSFLVHPLVENAVKHGMRSGSIPLAIRLIARLDGDVLRIEVANTGRLARSEAGASAPVTGAGIGLENIRRRLEQMFHERSHFELSERDGWTRAVIEIQR
jgi:two-component system, LytTR family, sensor kinase